MAFTVDDYGEITLIQGDSGELKISGLETDRYYTVYLAIQDSKRNPIGSEISVEANKRPEITIVFPPSLTNLLTVKKGNEYELYYYGIKVCNSDDDFENTLLIGDSDFGDLNSITVYPKKVEGTING